MRRLSLILALLVCLAAAPVAAQPAGECVVGPGLGATLLIPYFELDLSDPLGVNTLFAVNNGLSVSTLARVVFWTDWGVPTLAFDLFLTGFDVQTINVRSIFDGALPSTGDGFDLSGFPGCDLAPPQHANPVLSVSELAQLVADHTGTASPIDGLCAGENHEDGILRGYITVDVVDECNGIESFAPTVTPARSGAGSPYFSEGGGSAGIAGIQNKLWGDVVYIDFNGNAAQGSEAIAVWANPAKFDGSDIFTFYGRYSGWDGRDERVPFSDLWDQRFLDGGPFSGGADFLVWRDTGSSSIFAVTCGNRPSWFPLTGTTIALDEEASNLVDLGDPFPLATQRVPVSSLGIPYSFGWVQIDTANKQAWVQPTLSGVGLFSASFNGTPFGSLCTADPTP